MLERNKQNWLHCYSSTNFGMLTAFLESTLHSAFTNSGTLHQWSGVRSINTWLNAATPQGTATTFHSHIPNLELMEGAKTGRDTYCMLAGKQAIKPVAGTCPNRQHVARRHRDPFYSLVSLRWEWEWSCKRRWVGIMKSWLKSRWTYWMSRECAWT